MLRTNNQLSQLYMNAEASFHGFHSDVYLVNQNGCPSIIKIIGKRDQLDAKRADILIEAMNNYAQSIARLGIGVPQSEWETVADDTNRYLVIERSTCHGKTLNVDFSNLTVSDIKKIVEGILDNLNLLISNNDTVLPVGLDVRPANLVWNGTLHYIDFMPPLLVKEQPTFQFLEHIDERVREMLKFRCFTSKGLVWTLLVQFGRLAPQHYSLLKACLTKNLIHNTTLSQFLEELPSNRLVRKDNKLVSEVTIWGVSQAEQFRELALGLFPSKTDTLTDIFRLTSLPFNSEPSQEQIQRARNISIHALNYSLK